MNTIREILNGLAVSAVLVAGSVAVGWSLVEWVGAFVG